MTNHLKLPLVLPGQQPVCHQTLKSQYVITCSYCMCCITLECPLCAAQPDQSPKKACGCLLQHQDTLQNTGLRAWSSMAPCRLLLWPAMALAHTANVKLQRVEPTCLYIYHNPRGQIRRWTCLPVKPVQQWQQAMKGCGNELWLCMPHSATLSEDQRLAMQ